MGISARVVALATGNTEAYSGQMVVGKGDSLSRALDSFVRFIRSSEVCPFPLPWFYAGMSPSMRSLHRLALKYDMDGEPLSGPGAQLYRTLKLLAWPFVVMALSLLFYRKYGRGLEGLSATRQIGRLMRLAFVRNIAPSDAYTFRFVISPEKAKGGTYFTQREQYRIFAVLQPKTSDIRLVNDKVAFDRHLRENDLPSPEILWPQTEGEVDGSAELPAVDLFAKPEGAYGGQGARLLQHQSGSPLTWSCGDTLCDQKELLALCDREGLMLQRRLSNHSCLQKLAGSGLSTFRIVTLLYPDGQVETLCAVLRMPVGGMVLDNYSAGGLIANVDLSTGRLEAAVAKDIRRGVVRHHPDSGATILGHSVPQIQDACVLCERAHGTIRGLTSVGWDIALTPQGAQIIEANINWSVDLVQLAMGQGLGETRFLNWELAWGEKLL